MYLSSGLSSTLVNDGRWHHLAGQVADNVWRIYVDGELENSTTYPYSAGDLRTPEVMTIGTYTYLTNFYFTGDIDEVRVWRTARTQAEIRATMCKKFAAAPLDLVAYYRFDQPSGTTATDHGAVPTPGVLVNLGSNSWHLSGAPLGDVSAHLYQAAWPAGSRVALATALGDSAIVSSISAQTRGVQLYAVNSAPTVLPPGAGVNAYVGVFTAGPAAATNGYALRLRPAAGPGCRNAFARGANDLAWTLPPPPPTTVTSLLLPPAFYRSEHLLTDNVLAFSAITGDSLICPGATTQLSVVAPGSLSLLWSTGATAATVAGLAPGTYTVLVTYGPGCARTLRRTVRPAPALALAIIGDSLLCPGGSTTLTAVAAGAASYRWSTGATSAALANVGPGTYTVTVATGTGCAGTARRTVRTVPVPGLAISGDSVLCAGSATTLTASAPGATAYRWSTGATTAALPVTQPGSYTVAATYGPGCTVAARRTVRLGTAGTPPAFALGADTTLCEGDQVLLRGPAGAGLRYQWSDGSTGRVLAVQTAGRYTLRVLAACGEQSAARTVALRACLLVPNVVTANADGRNDLFAVQALRGEGWALDVYNRWGRAVYSTPNYHNDWGRDAAPGVYYVQLRRPATGFRYRGWLEVLR